MECEVGIERKPIKLIATKRSDIFGRINEENKKNKYVNMKAETEHCIASIL